MRIHVALAPLLFYTGTIVTESLMAQQTPLHASHIAAGARMVDFAGWNMPVNYGSQIEEHHAVRRDAGMFDVSHMLALDLEGVDAKAFLRGLIANDVAKLTEPGKALYSCMLNEQGGVIDDLIVYFLTDTHYRIVVNAGTADKDVAWMEQHLAATGTQATLAVRRDLAMIAVQGPNARAKTWAALPGAEAASASLKVFQAAAFGDIFIARTGLHRRGRFRADPADRQGRRHLGRPRRSRSQALRPRRPRHPAPGGRHGPLRQRHGR